MIIKRVLKHAYWAYSDETNQLTAYVDLPELPKAEEGMIRLNKTYAYSLARFLLRTFQRQSMKHRKNTIPEDGIEVVTETPEEV